MSLVSTKDILTDAMNGNYAIPAFNVENMEMLKACVNAAKQKKTPVIIQASEKTIEYIGIELLFEMVRSVSTREGVEIALHLDHGKNLNIIRQACELGFSSVMIDASNKDFSLNVESTLQCIEIAKEYGIPVEAELGHVGGKEEDIESFYTTVEEAKRFVLLTKVDFLAIAIGTQHGLYRGEPVLDFERLLAIRKQIDIPLVLHGASGLSDTCILNCIQNGIAKVNFATELRRVGTDALRKSLLERKDLIDPRQYGYEEQLAIQKCVNHIILICRGENGKQS